MPSCTQKVWAVGFRQLKKQINLYQSRLCVEMLSIMVPWYILLQIHESTIHRVFVACVILMEAIFSRLQLCQLHETFILGRLWLEFLRLEWG